MKVDDGLILAHFLGLKKKNKELFQCDRSSRWVCCRYFAGVAGSNPAWVMDISLLSGIGFSDKPITCPGEPNRARARVCMSLSEIGVVVTSVDIMSG